MSNTGGREWELREQYPRPSAAATERARAAVIHAARDAGGFPPGASARRPWRWRPILITAGVAAVVAAAGVAIALSLLNVAPPRFRSTSGWHVGHTGTQACVGVTLARCVQAEAWASTVPYRDCAVCTPPRKTLAALPPGGIVIQLSDVRERPSYGPLGSWPPRLRVSQVGGFEGLPTRFGVIQVVRRSRDGVEHFLWVWFGRKHPTTDQLARANAELRTVRPL
jgi:hypothetical protein